MAGWAAGADRQSRLSGWLHPKDRNEEEEPGSARFAGCRGGTRGKRRPPRYSDAGGQRHRARAMSAALRSASAARLQRSPTKKAPSNPAGRRGGVRPGLGASRRRDLRPDRACHAENKRPCDPWRLRRSPPERAHSHPRSALPAIGRPTSAIVARRDETPKVARWSLAE